jgi:uncharacterized membrane protein
MIYNHPMTQPPYGQNPYNQPAPAPSAPPAYQNAPAPAYPPGFPPAYTPGPVVPVALGYASASPYALPQPEKKSPVLGVVGLGVVVVCGIIFFLCGKATYDAMFDALGTGWAYSGNIPDTSAITSDQMSLIMGPLVGLMISALVGLVGFILSIVATVQNKGRIYAIVGIVLGVLAPFSIFIAVAMSMSAHGVI